MPAKENGDLLFHPRKIDSFLVGAALLAFGVLYLSLLLPKAFGFLPSWIFGYGGWILPIIFILRAIGEFKYVGFFKRIRNTDFARLDSLFYSPLCFAIGLLGLILLFSK